MRGAAADGTTDDTTTLQLPISHERVCGPNFVQGCQLKRRRVIGRAIYDRIAHGGV